MRSQPKKDYERIEQEHHAEAVAWCREIESKQWPLGIDYRPWMPLRDWYLSAECERWVCGPRVKKID